MAYVGLIAYGARIIGDWRSRRIRRRTRRIIEGLPTGIRKDIGWPDPQRADWPELGLGMRAAGRR